MILKPYEDELIYSLLARKYVHSGYLTYRDIADEIYANVYHEPDIYYINKVTPTEKENLERVMPIQKWILNYTMYNCHTRFMGRTRREKALTSLEKQDGKHRNLLAVPQQGSIYLKFCPLCVSKDRKKHGEAYWHRVHQLPQIKVCPHHKVYLLDSEIQVIVKQSPNLYPAEYNVSVNSVEECKNEYEVQMAELMQKLFEYQDELEIVPLIRFYMEKRGYKELFHYQPRRLQADMEKEFGEQSPSYTDITKMLQGKCKWYQTCQVLYFLKADITKQIEVPSNITDSSKMTIYRQVAEELGRDFGDVQIVGNAIFRRWDKLQQIEHSGGKKRFDYTTIDVGHMEEVREKCIGIYDRPAMVNKSIVARELGLPQKQIDRLPRCLAIIKEYEEPQENYWCRLLEYTISEMEQKGERVYWRAIRDKVNIRRKDLIERCIPIMDADLRKKMTEILGIDTK